MSTDLDQLSSVLADLQTDFNERSFTYAQQAAAQAKQNPDMGASSSASPYYTQHSSTDTPDWNGNMLQQYDPHSEPSPVTSQVKDEIDSQVLAAHAHENPLPTPPPKPADPTQQEQQQLAETAMQPSSDSASPSDSNNSSGEEGNVVPYQYLRPLPYPNSAGRFFKVSKLATHAHMHA